MNQKASCLVIGGAGCLGTHIVKMLLERGYKVAIFDIVSPPAALCNVHLIQGDITNSNSVAKALHESKAEIVYHTASIIDVRPVPSPLMHRVNVEGTRVVVEQCQKSEHCKTLVYTSSMEVAIGKLRNGKKQILNGCDENVPVPEQHFLGYAASKAAAEKLVLDADGQDGKLQTCSIRPSFIIGDGTIGHQMELRRCARYYGYDLGIKLSVGISCVNPKSAADLHILAAEKIKEISHGESFFARDFDDNYMDLKSYAFQDTGITPIFLPLWFAYAFCWILDRWEKALHFLFILIGWSRNTSRDVIALAMFANATEVMLVRSEKAERLLGWSPLVSKEETMEEAREHAHRYWKSLVAAKSGKVKEL